MEEQVGLIIAGRGVPVDQHQAMAWVIIDQTRGGIDRQAGAGHDQKVGFSPAAGVTVSRTA